LNSIDKNALIARSDVVIRVRSRLLPLASFNRHRVPIFYGIFTKLERQESLYQLPHPYLAYGMLFGVIKLSKNYIRHKDGTLP